MTTSVKVVRDSTTHLALQYLKMKNTFVSVDNLFNLSPAKYKSKSKAQRALETLSSQGLAIKRNDMYHISHYGIQACFRIPREQPRIHE